MYDVIGEFSETARKIAAMLPYTENPPRHNKFCPIGVMINVDKLAGEWTATPEPVTVANLFASFPEEKWSKYLDQTNAFIARFDNGEIENLSIELGVSDA